MGIGEQFAGVGVADHLTYVDGDAAVRLLREGFGLDGAGDGSELPVPVVANRRAADYSTAFPLGDLYRRP